MSMAEVKRLRREGEGGRGGGVMGGGGRGGDGQGGGLMGRERREGGAASSQVSGKKEEGYHAG